METIERQKEIKKGYSFEIGDVVGRKNLAASKNIRSLSAEGKWIGPYEIIECFPNGVSYRIQRIDDLKETLAINGSQLAKWDIIITKTVEKRPGKQGSGKTTHSHQQTQQQPSTYSTQQT